MRHDKAHWVHDMRGRAQQYLALVERFAHQAKLVLLEITQPAVHQLAAGRRGVLREVVLFA